MTTTRPKLSDDERAARVELLNNKLAQAIESLTTSDGWLRMLKTAAKFSRYSINNVCLLAAQAEWRGTTLTRVAGYQTWLSVGRCVSRGEHGYTVIAPVRRRLSLEEANERRAQGLPAFGDDGRPIMVIRGFKGEAVFDIGQTFLVDPEKWAEAPEMIQHAGAAPEGLWEALVGLLNQAGFTVELRPPIGSDEGAHGWTDYRSGIVWIRSDVDQAEQVRLAAHELSHVRAEHEQRRVPREQREAEADSIAYIVCEAMGLSIEDSAAQYIGSWAGTGDEQVATLTAAAGAVHSAASSILADLEDMA